MQIKMNEKEMQLSIEGLIRILDAMKDTEFVLLVPLEDLNVEKRTYTGGNVCYNVAEKKGTCPQKMR